MPEPISGQQVENSATDAVAQMKPTPLRRALAWLPVGLGAVLLACGGLAVVFAGQGQGERLAQASSLVMERETAASEAEALFAADYAEMLQSASGLDAARLDADEALGEQLLSAALEGDPELARLLEEQRVPADAQFVTSFLPSFDADELPASDSGEALASFDAVLVRVSAAEYTYFATATLAPSASDQSLPQREAALRWTTDGMGSTTSIEAYWAEPGAVPVGTVGTAATPEPTETSSPTPSPSS